MKIVLIRHTSVDVRPGICYGQSDVGVRDSFGQEAAKVREAIKAYSFDRVYSSPLSRCRMLASACGYDSPELDPRLMEINFGEWEMKAYDEIDDPRLQEWYDDFLNVRPTGGESSMEQCRRFLEFIDEIKACGYRTVGIFTHGGIIIHALVALAGWSYEKAFANQPAYGSVSEIDI